MKVKTLIKLLQNCNPESSVITEDGEGNVFDITNVELNGDEVQIMYGNGDDTYNEDLPVERKIRSYYPDYDLKHFPEYVLKHYPEYISKFGSDFPEYVSKRFPEFVSKYDSEIADILRLAGVQSDKGKN